MTRMNDDRLQQLPNVKISAFEGPLDLLLHLIKQAEMDIYDIQISEITSQYLAYLHVNQQLKLDVAGEYLIMAATLMRIKSKMLLPTKLEVDDESEEEQDPRLDLVTQLVEYQKFQQAAQNLKTYEEKRQAFYTRQESSVPSGMKLAHLAPGLTVDALQQAFQKIIIRQENAQPIHRTITEESFSIADQSRLIEKKLSHSANGLDFNRLFEKTTSVVNVVVTFMAMLELVKKRQITFQQSDRLGTIKLFSLEDDHGK
ncbi:segregation and condensation protein A [Pediococcus cellicola]|nr:segregation/condensation protein A [Pediococcus cellicola]